ncbi:ATP-grasp domain-containing protein [Streptomyces sp. SP18CS02]|uniref:ATP-grasp domain-containing protein n=1 Tax=Streptomyces sp. SP18CS02 TaxID=3002531 RepID=UPI002E771E39|nr:ATP-grasp domain-containing protein [Streptomyces sp. SP18CS02]MEE1752756.1 ATP-grasp domain-containing protein [Streptomyces sp. SP18CS02]
MPRILIVGGGLHFQQLLRDLSPDITTAVLCRAGTLGSVRGVEHHHAVVVLSDDARADDWCAAAKAIDRLWPIDRIASFSEVDQDKAAAVAHRLRLPFSSPDTVRAVNDKRETRARLRSAGIESLPYRPVDSVAELREFFHEAGPPLILKPSRARGSIGISLVRHPSDIDRAFQRSVSASGPRIAPSPLLAERFVDGLVLCVDALTHQGEHHVFAVSETVVDPGTQADLAHVTPARLPDAAVRTVTGHVRAALDALGVESGLTNTDVILGPDGPVIVETHLRASGNRIPELILLATGLDIVRLWLRQIAGEDIATAPQLPRPDRTPVYSRAAAIRFLTTRESGTLLGIDGWDEATALDGVHHVARLAPDGARLEGLQNDSSYLGEVIALADTASQALERSEAAVGSLRVRVGPPGDPARSA